SPGPGPHDGSPLEDGEPQAEPKKAPLCKVPLMSHISELPRRQLAGRKVEEVAQELLSLLVPVLAGEKPRGKPAFTAKGNQIFPLPLPPEAAGTWGEITLRSLNTWAMPESDEPSWDESSSVRRDIARDLIDDVTASRILQFNLHSFSWADVLKSKAVSYTGEEIKVAKVFSWDNIRHALPADGVAAVDVLDFCEAGLFGVSKDEWVAEVEVMRLIMNLVPVNEWFHPIEGDLQTLPVISQLHALDLDPSENLLLSSEDLKCYFYTLRVPDAWSKYFAFSKVVPQCFNPSGDSRPHVLASRVLPMGFASSVAVAQHVHRNVVRRSMHDPRSQLCPEGELRRDKFWSSHNPGWRVYLDNYDELSRHSTGSEPVGQRPASMKALRATYSESGMPVNEKKSCLAQLEGEMQGAPVNGDTGYALAKEDKFCKYLHMAVVVLESPCASLKEMQILTGGMVYLASFRRVAMSCLNEIWRFLQKLAQDMKRLLIPPAVRREIALFIGVAPLLQIRFRNCISPIVTASDASETGGGVVASVSVTGYGLEASQRKVRGETPEWWDGAQILGIGVGDNIGSFRVALDVLQVPLAGYVSVVMLGFPVQYTLECLPKSEAKRYSDLQSLQQALTPGGDSMVALHVVTRGRSSGRKLRDTMLHISALVLAANLRRWASRQTASGYVDDAMALLADLRFDLSS
ncbi:unnamed protein product, partial [Symbiodinium microadriaticum]